MMATATDSDHLTPWTALSSERQLELRMAYGHYLDILPPTCSLATKLERFPYRPAERGIRYQG